MRAKKSWGRGVRHNPRDPVTMNINYNKNGVITSSKNLRYEIGELLWCLQFPIGQELSQIGWGLFERLLRRYIGLKCTSQCLSEPLESSKTLGRVMAKESEINSIMTREQQFKARKWDKMFISRSVITSKAFLALRTACACQVYLIFLSKCRVEKVQTRPMSREKEWQITNNGEIQFKYIEAETDYGIPAGKFTRAIDENIRVGLIDITKTGMGLHKDVTLYAISDRWEKFGTAEFVVQKRPKRKQQFGFAGKSKGSKRSKQKQHSQIAVEQRA